ncbi:hypothetical protein OEA41_000995 [Lepraria neglecta]|uniref:Uncharacterized protein n=1 Tax=Lepraria neglecta TaxID=209136 RepID=A0AAE0DRN6_9LECA|nr:hypothetical protein OEA41_000995 [Lepraria neglecta]
MEESRVGSMSPEDTMMEEAPVADDTESSITQVESPATVCEPLEADPKVLKGAAKPARNGSKLKDAKSIEQLNHELHKTLEQLKDSESKRKKAEGIAKERRRQLEEAEANSHALQDAYTRASNTAGIYKRKHEELDNTHKKFYKHVTDQLQASEQSRTVAEAKARTLESRAQDLETELRACKDELFSLQPADQVTDSQIGADWDNLCRNIVHWIDNQSGGMSSLSSQLQELLANDKFNDAISFFWGKETQILAKHYPNILEDLLRYNIHLLLERNIFNENLYMLGILKKETTVLSFVEKSLSTLEPKREALNAICATPEFALRQKEAARENTQEAVEFLQPLLPNLKKDAMAVFHSEITETAIKFASTMRRSSAYYHFVFRLGPNSHVSQLSNRPSLPSPGKGVPLFPSDLDKVNVLDMESRMTLKPNMALNINKDGSIGRTILIIHPALYRRAATEEILLRKQVALTELPKTFERRARPKDVESSRGLISWLSNFS